MSLVISRQQDEKTILTVPPSDTATRIQVDVNRIKRDQVRLSFDAPRAVSIQRKEIQDDIDRRITRPARAGPDQAAPIKT
jgi:carbon storage regulator CsrA